MTTKSEQKRYAIISVSDKTGIYEFAKELCSLGFSIISTGGTAKLLSDKGLEVTNISDITGFPECLDGRVKTLHPSVHGGLLAMRSNPEHMETLKKLGISTIDIAVINLYPFKQTISKDDVKFEDAIENIDIGGPTMIRAAAKNHNDVTVIVDPGDYEKVLNELRESGNTTYETRRYLAYKVFAHTAAYDALIAEYLQKQCNIEFPDSMTVTFEAAQDLRYGENPHQKAKFYKELVKTEGTIVSAQQLHGKELSYNNIADTNGALEILREFSDITVVAVKHANPCGVASGKTLFEAWQKAYACDPTSIFGGIVAVNTTMDAKTAEEINKIFIEIVVAPDYTKEALEILSAKKNIRLLKLPAADLNIGMSRSGMDYKRVSGGLLVQERDTELIGEIEYVTDKKPTEEQMKDLMFAWKLVKHVKSNAIALVKDGASVGIGCGQVNRIWATEQAIEHGGENTKGSVMASDAFFPFDDCVRAAAKAGITAIIHPGGSKNDQMSIDACNELGIAMIFVGKRHFKHS